MITKQTTCYNKETSNEYQNTFFIQEILSLYLTSATKSTAKAAALSDKNDPLVFVKTNVHASRINKQVIQ